MMVLLKVSRSTIAAQSRVAVNVFVQPEYDAGIFIVDFHQFTSHPE